MNKKIQAITLLIGLAIIVLAAFNLNTIICTGVMIPAALNNPEFDIVLFFESCGR